MTVLEFANYLVLGKLVMFIARKSPYFRLKLPVLGDFLKALFDCELCLGVWVYGIVAIIFDLNIFEIQIPLISQVLTGMVMSFVMWLITDGWNAKFRIIYME